MLFNVRFYMHWQFSVTPLEKLLCPFCFLCFIFLWKCWFALHRPFLVVFSGWACANILVWIRSVHLKWISQLPLPMLCLHSRAVMDPGWMKPGFLLDVNKLWDVFQRVSWTKLEGAWSKPSRLRSVYSRSPARVDLLYRFLPITQLYSLKYTYWPWDLPTEQGDWLIRRLRNQCKTSKLTHCLYILYCPPPLFK